MADMRKIPVSVTFPGGVGAALVSQFLNSLPDWLQSALGWLGVGLMLWSVVAVAWHLSSGAKFSWRLSAFGPRLRRDWNMQQAVNWWAEATNRQTADGGDHFFDDLRQLARDEEIVIWGRPNNHGVAFTQFSAPHEAIPAAHWRTHDFDVLRYIFGDSEGLIREATSPPGSDSTPDIRYSDLCVTSADLKKHRRTFIDELRKRGERNNHGTG